MRDLSAKEKIIPVYIEEEMKSSYLSYSMSVIVGRALPDVRDGLKPVHRRILYAMFREGLLSNRRFSKCAGVVGEVLKKWNDGKYPGQLVSYAAYCKSIVDPLNAKKLHEFMAQVVVDFSITGTDVDYLKLVELMAGGNAPTVCGKDPAGDGKSVDCP